MTCASQLNHISELTGEKEKLYELSERQSKEIGKLTLSTQKKEKDFKTAKAELDLKVEE